VAETSRDNDVSSKSRDADARADSAGGQTPTGRGRVATAVTIVLCALAGALLVRNGAGAATVLALQLGQAVFVMTVIRALGASLAGHRLPALGVTFAVVLFLSAASAGAWARQPQPAALLLVALVLCVVHALPRPERPSLAAMAAAGLALLALLAVLSAPSTGETMRLFGVVGVASALLGAAVSAAGFEGYRERHGRDHAALARAERRLMALNAQIERRVSERTARLEQANRQLESFSHAVSHDLRAPLRVVSGFADALLEDHDSLLQEDGIHHVRRIKAATRRMDDIIAGLLQLARAEHPDLSTEVVDLGELARDAVADLRVVAPERRVALDVEGETVVHGDPRLLAVLMANLVGNAWKFSSGNPDACILVRGVDRDGQRIVSVIDNGVGFAPELAADLFLPLRRAHRESDFPGSGIGLATAARIVARHGGTITAEAPATGGAAFHCTLPGVSAVTPGATTARS
jgi:signal transduction histidine kinase